MPVVDPNPTQPPADNPPVPTGTTISLPGGKQIVVGGSLASVIVAGAMFVFDAHKDAMEKISALDAKVTVLQASLQEMKADGSIQRAEVRQDIKELNQAVNSLARSLKVSAAVPRSGSGLPLDLTWQPGEVGGEWATP